MATPIRACLIWGDEYKASGFHLPQNRISRVDSSPRAGGGYQIDDVVVNSRIAQMSDAEKARLTTWLVDQRMQGDEMPEVTEAVINHVKTNRPLLAHERADRLLRFISDQTDRVGIPYEIRRLDPGVYAWSESTDGGEIGYLIDYLRNSKWIDERFQARFISLGDYDIPAFVRVTVDGNARIAVQRANIGSTQAFIAMWFDETMTDAYTEGIEPAVKAAGYTPLRIDQKQHINKVDDEIIAEIRRSRLLVADFTHGDAGARGGVYYEAGFARGLGLPVFYTCRKDMVNELHFDTRQFNHVLWETHSELRESLWRRIVAVIGECQNSLPPLGALTPNVFKILLLGHPYQQETQVVDASMTS